MTYFLNAFGAALLASGFAALAMWIRDMNKLPYTAFRSALAWYCAAYSALTCAAWIINAQAGTNTPFGKLIQAWQWTGRASGGLVLVISVSLSYRRSAIERQRKKELVSLMGG